MSDNLVILRGLISIVLRGLSWLFGDDGVHFHMPRDWRDGGRGLGVSPWVRAAYSVPHADFD